jgi:uncharacterized protein YcfL
VRTACWLLLLVFLAGCGSSPAPPVSPEQPLTIEDWKKLPAAEKYDVVTFERLKSGNPKLQDEREWNKFTRDVVMPAKKQEQPKP